MENTSRKARVAQRNPRTVSGLVFERERERRGRERRTSQNVRRNGTRIEDGDAIPEFVEKETFEKTEIWGDVFVGF